MLGSLLLLFSLAVTIGFALMAMLLHALGIAADPGKILLICSLLFTLPFALARQVDRMYGARLRPGGVAQRALSWLFHGYSLAGMGRGNNPTFALLSSHGGERRLFVLIFLVIATATIAVAWSYNVQNNPGKLGNYALFPSSHGSEYALDAAHYDDRRNPARDNAVPYIQSMVVTGPYLQLIVPYQPERDATALRRECAAALNQHDEPARSAATLACLQRLHPVLLDGQAVRNLQYELSSDTRTDRPALLAMIDVRSLHAGRHALSIGPRAGNDKRADADSYRIPFWR